LKAVCVKAVCVKAVCVKAVCVRISPLCPARRLVAWLPWRAIVGLPGRGMRWVPTADEVGFYSPRVARFFALGGSVPTYRGDGVYQRAIDFSLEVLDRGGRRSRLDTTRIEAAAEAAIKAAERNGGFMVDYKATSPSPGAGEEERRQNGWVTGGSTAAHEIHQYDARGWVHIFPEGLSLSLQLV
jgi:hypothetical protein